MAVISLYVSTNMEGAEIWYGEVVSYNSSSIVLQAGSYTGTYSGSFTYDSWGYVYGQLYSYRQTYNGALQVNITSINRDAYTYNSYLIDGNAQGAMGYILSGADTVNGSAWSDRLIGLAGADKINGGGGADRLSGGTERDVLNGGTGDDSLYGGDHGDVLIGGAGADDLYGGAGADTFQLNSAAESRGATGRDAIFDFQHGLDKINLSVIDARPAVAGDQGFVFIGNAAFGGVAGQLRYANGVVFGDIDGNSAPDFAIELVSRPALTASDFVL